MVELRIDRLTGRQVLFASGRIARPRDFPKGEREVIPPGDCPFCEGHEDQTPKEIWALREGSPDAPGWQIRVVPNKYPISEDHEVIIETPAHQTDLPDLPPAQAERIIKAYQTRLGALAQKGRWPYLALFKNYGWAAGASRVHPHAQLVGLPSVPPLIERELQIAQDFYLERGRCLYCETLERELELKERVIEADEHFLVWSPQAARVPWECWILPRRHRASFLDLGPKETIALAGALQRTLKRIKRVLSGLDLDFAYNYSFHIAPLFPKEGRLPPAVEEGYHWHIEVLPRLGRLAGLEWGTGLYINPLLPEQAAAKLRQVAVE